VLVPERDRLFGGTSAISGGALWNPGSRQGMAGGFRDSIRGRPEVAHLPERLLAILGVVNLIADTGQGRA
jgi:hypothetical protein